MINCAIYVYKKQKALARDMRSIGHVIAHHQDPKTSS